MRKKFILSGQYLDNTRFTINSEDFEEYIESIHDWHNSEEYKNSLRKTKILRV